MGEQHFSRLAPAAIVASTSRQSQVAAASHIASITRCNQSSLGLTRRFMLPAELDAAMPSVICARRLRAVERPWSVIRCADAARPR